MRGRSFLTGRPPVFVFWAGPSWARHKVILPTGWSSVEVDRIGVRGEPMRLRARHGAGRAELLKAG